MKKRTAALLALLLFSFALVVSRCTPSRAHADFAASEFVAVPEPSTYGFAAAVALVLGVWIRKRAP